MFTKSQNCNSWENSLVTLKVQMFTQNWASVYNQIRVKIFNPLQLRNESIFGRGIKHRPLRA